MTNTQQTIPGQASAAEQPREEMRFTELLPVEKSRIEETVDGKDADATDALKALRSFSRSLVGEYAAQMLDFAPSTDAVDFAVEDPPRVVVEKKSGDSGKAVPRKRRGNKQGGEDGGREKKPGRKRQRQRVDEHVEHVDESREIYEFRQEVCSRVEETEGESVDPILVPSTAFDEEIVLATPEAPTCEESLRRRINAIIRANYVFERENNNVAHGDDDGDTLGAPTTGQLELNPEQVKKYRCVACSARFKGSGGLRNHYKVVHATGPIFTCNECGKGFPLKERLKLHVRTHTGFKPYKCPECDKSFARGGQLVQHRRTHSQVKPYRCALCSGTFTCAANLALHVKRHNGQKDHKCEICGRGFVRRDALKKHLECLHRDVKSFLCVICNKTFKGHLPQHMRTHAQDRPHGCATCGQRFAQKSQLTVHLRTHSGQRPFRCLVCWQAFAHSTALKLHTRRHTGERPFKCAECNAGFTQLPHWKKHMKCIHGRSEPYRCSRCGSFFRIKNDLEAHEKDCMPGVSDDALTQPICALQGVTTISAAMLPRYRVMTVEKMRLLLAVLLKRISKPRRLDELGFGKRLIDEVLVDSLIAAGKDPAKSEGLGELDVLRRNLETFLEWTVPREHWENFRRMGKTPEDILETLTAI
ncbi:zinc finger protein 708 [Orussus abietinus]|uniref:zinc finger protein 708 n=1 Tax=Orussus abietinus TaxID=222816 RepID=UPI0006258FE1|nr:zinc finger protein 708 [Orussus abietinus]XP_012274423.1 zinc finger protein 708 [Orussus abietinus]XP_023290248.1 zinc finger protein 708 [Orussus abietinus]